MNLLKMSLFRGSFLKVTLENDVNIPCSSSILDKTSTGVTPLPMWNIPPGHTDPVTQEQLNQSSAQYMCLCHAGEDNLTPASRYQQWSVPLRISSHERGNRLNMSVPLPCAGNQTFRYRMLTLSLHIKF